MRKDQHLLTAFLEKPTFFKETKHDKDVNYIVVFCFVLWQCLISQTNIMHAKASSMFVVSEEAMRI